MNPEQPYAPGHAASQTQHHEWRTASNSAAHLLPHLHRAAQQLQQQQQATPRPLQLLDVGAGSGTISASLAQHLAPLGGTVLATDISDDILARAAAHAADVGAAGNMAFRRASVYALPFADGAFDVVHAHQVLCHLKAPVEAVREMVRVCRGGGGGGGLVALRESDLHSWCVWPETEGLRKFHRLMVATLVANGGEDRGGRKLLSWVLEAGVDREDVEAGFGAWCFSTSEDKRVWGESMISRLQSGQMRDKGLEMGITTVEDIEDMIKAWREWIETEGATLGLMNGEVIVKKN
ncbi:S-adenosyl-L-methionine-dependent methyltransferase [Chaetomium tenue]|uniref:S-adenosyl-L-methionine-dependent methyltransferase n=1 Tax=Chaetomium tenue TaxID=1854479 RepID=A0ACB7NVI5_9PEZI|nr:S-adenosyl-L-methionine-dependent methyltransferase [Chaetomium globosum]